MNKVLSHGCGKTNKLIRKHTCIILYTYIHTSGVVLGGFLKFPETPSKIACAPTIRLGDKNYKELYILYYIMAFF